VWFDSHCHLFLCEGREPANALVDRALAAGVDDMLVAGIDAASSRRALELADLDGVHAAAGIHPNESAGWEASWIEEVSDLLDGGAVAVGESGLDFYRDAASPDDQRAAFAAHIQLARERDRALIIHTRASADAALRMLEELSPPARLVFHCWSGDERQLERALELGACVSFAGNVSFDNAGDLRTVAARVPGDRLLVETDSPFLAPAPYRGRPNEPALVALVGAALARARGDPEEAVASATSANARRLIGLGQ
jgi:TatD DNase family protein